MESSLSAIVTAVWLGILTSISPCPLASNIAALSYLSKNLQSRSVKTFNHAVRSSHRELPIY
jgi:cytochrome c biogenesis protein CcdA